MDNNFSVFLLHSWNKKTNILAKRPKRSGGQSKTLWRTKQNTLADERFPRAFQTPRHIAIMSMLKYFGNTYSTKYYSVFVSRAELLQIFSHLRI